MSPLSKAFTNLVEAGIMGTIPESYCSNYGGEGVLKTRSLLASCAGKAAVVANCSCCDPSIQFPPIRVVCTEIYPQALVDKFLFNN
jgi:hypothetical protein